MLEPLVAPIVPADSAFDRYKLKFLLGYQESTRRSYQYDLLAWSLFCEAHEIDPMQIDRSIVDAWARQMDEMEGLKPATVARRLCSVRGLYQYMVDEGVLYRNPVDAVRRPKVEDHSTSTGVDLQEGRALLRAAEGHGNNANALIHLLLLNGLRISEALNIDIENFAYERGHQTIRIVRKGGAVSTIPLDPQTADALDTCRGARSEGPLFLGAHRQRMDRVAAWRLVRSLAKEAVPTKPNLHPHDLRHAFITLSLDAGASLRDVQDAADHADPRTTRRYDRARHNLDRHPTYRLSATLS